jgi:hypothetical protein
MDTAMDRDLHTSESLAELERVAIETTGIAEALRIEFDELLVQIQNLTRQSNISSARVGVRLTPAVTRIQRTLSRLEQMAQANRIDSPIPAWSPRAKTLTAAKRSSKRHGIVEVY